MVLWTSAEASNAITNGDFSKWNDAKPDGWIVRTKQPLSKASAQGGLNVEIAESSKGFGEILQKIPVEKDARYRLTGQIKGTAPGLAFYQIKRYKDGREVDRIGTDKNVGSDWGDIEKVFTSDGAEYVEILLRWQQKEEHVGNTVGFNNVVLEKLPPYSYQGEEVAPRVVPTFESAGIYWKPTGGSSSREVTVHFRQEGDSEWREALSLWFDDYPHASPAEQHTGEYRGSIVYLEAGTDYEVRLNLQDGPERIVKFSTWSDDFKIARTVTLPENFDGVYEITEGGSEAEGYVLYTPAKGVKAVWNASEGTVANINVSASWVIIRGLTLKGAKNHGIVLGDVNNVVIENCDISGWGETKASGQAINLNSAIYSSSKQLERIIIQNCEMHHPRSDSNSWAEKRPGSNSSHPEGPQGISFRSGKGQFVIRHNKIYSDMDHMFNDGMGELRNFGYGGFPNRDSDIYGNFVSHCWDDGLEIEGADMNVRVWDNYIDMTYGAIGAAAPALGPVYFFRNVYGVSRKHSGMSDNDLRGHYLVKLGNEKPQYTQGKMYIFHNTSLQPPAFEGSNLKSSGAQSGIVFTSKKKLQQNITSRNNVLQMRGPNNWAIIDTQNTYSNDFDYDMYDGRIRARDGSQENGLIASPVYERAPDGRLWLQAGSPGVDAAFRLPNFNDDFTGEAPDMGAVERNSKQSKPKTWPDFPENYYPEPEQVQQEQS